WAKQIGGAGADTAKGVATGVAVDGSTTVYVTGSFKGNAWFGTQQCFAPNAAITDGYVTKLDASGGFLWAHKFDATSEAGLNPRGIAVDSNGNAYATGYYWPGFLGPGAKAYFDPANSPTAWNTLQNQIDPMVANGCAFVVKLNTSGTFQWVRGAAGNIDGVNA